MSAWRSGLNVTGAVAAAAPVVALVAVGVAQATSETGDIRKGAFPWLFALAAMCFAVCCMGLLSVHSPDPGGWLLVGAWWTALAFSGVAGAFLAIAVGGALGIDEESAGVLAWLPVMGMTFGIISMTPAVGVTAIGAGRRSVLPTWGKTALWVAAPLVPVLMIYGGIVEDTAETVGSAIILGLMALTWVLVGLSIRAAESRVETSRTGA